MTMVKRWYKEKWIGDYNDAIEKFGLANVRRFDLELVINDKWFTTTIKQRVKFLEELEKQGIPFVFRPSTFYGHARVYIHKKDLEKVVELFKKMFIEDGE